MSRWSPEAVALPLAEGAEVLADFERRLDAAALAPGTRVRVVVGSGLLRWAVVPWHPSVLRPAAREVLARHAFRTVHGDVAQGWAVCCTAPRHGAAMLAGALDAAWLDGVRALLAARSLRLVGVQPGLTVEFDRVCASIKPGLFWFVLHEPRWTTLLLLERGAPLLVKRLPALADLGRCLDREWLALGLEAPRCPVHLAATADAGAVDGGRWHVERAGAVQAAGAAVPWWRAWRWRGRPA